MEPLSTKHRVWPTLNKNEFLKEITEGNLMDREPYLQHSVESCHVNTLAVVQLSDDDASPVNNCLHTNT